MAKLVICNIGGMLCLEAAAAKDGRFIKEIDLDWRKYDSLVCGEQGEIAWIGKGRQLPVKYHDYRRIDAGGRELLPAFVECHTHSVFAGNRATEFEQRNQGMSYQRIAQAGGGILSTVRDTRRISLPQLVNLAQQRMDRFAAQGVATVEVKSGYGLDFATEKKMLQVAKKLGGVRVVATYLGAHAFPPGVTTKPQRRNYLRQVMTEDLPRLAAQDLCQRVDIFVDEGFFAIEDIALLAQQADKLGLGFCVHGDQLGHTGACAEAARWGAQSVEHAIHLRTRDRNQLAASKTTVVLLPSADLYLRLNYPDARKLIDAGARVALATDFNPGSAPSQDLSLVGLLARSQMRMSLPECLVAYTYNAAAALGLQNQLGSIEVGKRADFLLLEGSWRDLFYSVGYHPIAACFRDGRQISGKKLE